MIYRLNPTKTPGDGILGASPKASVFHSVGWLQALQSTYGYEPMVFTTSLQRGVDEWACSLPWWRAIITGRRLVSLAVFRTIVSRLATPRKSRRPICNFREAFGKSEFEICGGSSNGMTFQ